MAGLSIGTFSLGLNVILYSVDGGQEHCLLEQ